MIYPQFVVKIEQRQLQQRITLQKSRHQIQFLTIVEISLFQLIQYLRYSYWMQPEKIKFLPAFSSSKFGRYSTYLSPGMFTYQLQQKKAYVSSSYSMNKQIDKGEISYLSYKEKDENDPNELSLKKDLKELRKKYWKINHIWIGDVQKLGDGMRIQLIESQLVRLFNNLEEATEGFFELIESDEMTIVLAPYDEKEKLEQRLEKIKKKIEIVYFQGGPETKEQQIKPEIKEKVKQIVSEKPQIKQKVKQISGQKPQIKEKVKEITEEKPQINQKIEQEQKEKNKTSSFKVHPYSKILDVVHGNKDTNESIWIPNFSKITDEEKSVINNFRYSMNYMLLAKNREEAKQDFIYFSRQIEDKPQDQEKSINNFLNDYPIERNAVKTFNWYCYKSFFHRTLNRSLRIFSQPEESVYLRLPFSDLFASIQEVYQQNRKAYRSEQQTYYRSCKLSQSEYQYFRNHINGYIQMEGFLSTYEDRNSVSRNFLQNTVLKVKVPPVEHDQIMDYGFAKLTEKYSTHYTEKQVLFNAMNLFKILKVYKEKTSLGEKSRGQEEVSVYIDVVQLEYQTMTQIYLKFFNKDELEKEEKELLNFDRFMRRGTIFSIGCQGDLLFETHKHLKSTNEYFMKKVEKIQEENKASLAEETVENQKKNNIKLETYYLARIALTESSCFKALQIFKQIKKKRLTVFKQEQFPISGVSKLIAIYSRKLKSFNQAEKITERILENIDKGDAFHASMIHDLGLIYAKTNRKEKAIEQIQKCRQIQRQLLTEIDLNYTIATLNLAPLYLDTDPDKALQLLKIAEENFKILEGSHSIYLYYCRNNRALIDVKDGKHPQAYKELLQLVYKCQREKLHETPVYAQILTNFIYVCYLMGDSRKFDESFGKYAELDKDLKCEFENIRTLFWVLMKSEKYTQAIKQLRIREQIESQLYEENQKPNQTTQLIQLMEKLIQSHQKEQIEEKVEEILQSY